MAEITIPFLLSFTDTVSAAFNERFTTAPTMYGRFAMQVGSMARENVYPRMDHIPGLREWVGDRVLNGLSGSAFAIVNKTFEETLEVKRDDFEDDQYGFYTPIVAEMGQQAAELPDILTAGLLAAGESRTGYDWTAFFGNGHFTYDANHTRVGYTLPFSYTVEFAGMPVSVNLPVGSTLAASAAALATAINANPNLPVKATSPLSRAAASSSFRWWPKMPGCVATRSACALPSGPTRCSQSSPWSRKTGWPASRSICKGAWAIRTWRR